MRRCFRYEYVIKTIIITAGFILNIVYFVFLYSKAPFLSLFFLFSIPVLIIYNFRITVQRGHDLGLRNTPIISEFVPFYLFFKKGDCGINEYDEAINYKHLFTGRHCIDIYDKMFFINNEEYRYERYLGKYSIKISNYGKENIFTEHLLKNYPVKEEQMHRTGTTYKAIEIPEDEFNNLINQMNFIVIKNSFYVRIKEFEVFIRKEDFKYTIILDKNINNISKELLDVSKFPGLFFENEKYICYNKINKKDLLSWIKYVV